MEGGADSNSDNQITARELHTYVRENVIQQSGGSQVPELQGDAERVLVRFDRISVLGLGNKIHYSSEGIFGFPVLR